MPATFDGIANLTYSTVSYPPAFAGSDITLGVAPGTGPNYPAVPFNCTVWPRGAIPLKTNAEIIRVTAVNGDIFTILRAQEGTTMQPINVGYQIANTATAKTFTDIQKYITGFLSDPGSNGIVKRTALGVTGIATPDGDYSTPAGA
jgi:hypothetical protein